MDNNLNDNTIKGPNPADYFDYGNANNEPTNQNKPVNQNPSLVNQILDNYNQIQKTNPSWGAGGEALARTLLQRTQTPDYPGKSFGRKVGEDVIALGAGIPIALSHPFETAKSLITTKENPVGGALLGSAKEVFSPSYYKEHPLSAVFNDAIWISNIFDLGYSSVVKGIVDGGLRTATENVADLGLKSSIDSSVLKNAVKESIKSGDANIIGEASRASLIRNGLDETTAGDIATKVQDNIVNKLNEKAGVLKTLQPIKTAVSGTKSFLKPIKELILGNPAESAVGRLYPLELIKQNPEGFSSIENWASEQLKQQGLKDTINNRIVEINKWSRSNSEWASLKPLEKADYQMKYVKASEMTQELNNMLGQTYVPTRMLDNNTIESINQTIKDTPIEDNGFNLIQELDKTFGSDLQNYKNTIDNIVKKNDGNSVTLKSDLINLVDSLRSSGGELKVTGSKEADSLIQKIKDETGYTPTLPPEGKTIIFAKNNIVDKSLDTNLTDSLVAHRTKLGKFLDKAGFSMQGTPEGTIEATYANKFSQMAEDKLGVSRVTIGTTTVPVNKLFSYLDKIKSQFPTLSGKYSIADITSGDLIRLGVDKDLAYKISSLAKRSAVLPVSTTGLAQTLVDTAQAYVPGFNRFVDSVSYVRYNSAFSPFFALRFYGKMQFLKLFETGEFKLQWGSGIGRIPDIIRKIPYIKDTINPEVSIGETKLMSDEVFSRMPKATKDYISNPDINLDNIDSGSTSSIKLGTKTNLKFQNRIQSRMFWHNIFNYSTEIDATGMSKVIARKFGMSLEDALSYTIKDGVKIYDNPSVMQKILDSVEHTFRYKSGLMTSPLMKTLNIAMFPLRFDTKVLTATAGWIRNMNPIYRTMIMSDLNHWTNFIQTPTGQKWVRDNRTIFQSTLEYILPYETLGMTFSDIAYCSR